MATVSARARTRTVAVRGWATTQKKSRQRRLQHSPPTPSGWSLTLDTETTTDLSQRLRVGAYQVRRGRRITEQGLIVEPGALTPAELTTIQRHAAQHGLRVLTRERFVEDVFYRVVYHRRGRLIVFNGPYDLVRLAVGHDASRATDSDPTMRGGFTLQLSEDPRRPRLQVKKVGSAAAFIRFTVPTGNQPEQRNRRKGGTAPHHRGFIVDVATLAKSLLGGRWSLARLAETLATDHWKLDVEGHGGEITPEYLDYALADVQVTWDCYDALHQRLGVYGLSEFTPDYRVYSEASIGKAHIKAHGIQPWRSVQPDVPDSIIATIMETYYGGRAECGIRRVAVPGVYLDFTSQYPTVFVLQRLWRFLTAQGVSWTEEAPDETQRLLDRVTVDDMLNRELWTQLHALVLVQPEDDRLPTRARYGRRRADGREDGSFTVGLPIRHGGPAQWYTLADGIATKLHTGHPPRVLRALRFAPLDPQPDLQPLTLAGNADYQVDPYQDDLIKRLIELRATVKRDQRAAETRGDLDEARRLDAIQQGMKVAANATSYGIPIEVNTVSHRTRKPVTVNQPDGRSYRTLISQTEQPGRYFHPLLATLTSSGGRLLLATALALAERLGGRHAMCDTDGLFIPATQTGGLHPCPGGSHTIDGHQAIRCLSWREVDDQVVAPFARLNPYTAGAVPGSILKIEAENFDPATGERRQIECFSISAKRYCLFERDPGGAPIIVGHDRKRKRSEHGLGHLLRPMPDEDWVTGWWEHLLRTELEYPTTAPRWFDDIAAGALTVTTPHELGAWKTYNQDRSYADQVRPFNFAMTAHPIRLKRRQPGTPRTLVAPLETDPEARRSANWVAKDDRTSRAYTARTTNPSYHIPSTVPVLTYGAYFHEYRGRPEHKAAGPDGQPCHAWTRGLLKPSIIEAAPSLLRIGKESLPAVDEDPDPSEPTGSEIVYTERVCPVCGAPVNGLQTYDKEACRKKETRARQLNRRA